VKLFRSCQYQFYKYGALINSQGCFFPDRVTKEQLTLVTQICTNYNKCITNPAGLALTAKNLKTYELSGLNTFISPLKAKKYHMVIDGKWLS
jgi:hypothetical protein